MLGMLQAFDVFHTKNVNSNLPLAHVGIIPLISSKLEIDL